MKTKPKVSIVHGQNVSGTPCSYNEADLDAVYNLVKESIDLIGGISSVVQPGDRVLLKVNSTGEAAADRAATTDPRVLQSVIRLIRDEAKPRYIKVMDRTGAARCTEQSFCATGLKDAALNAGADDVINLENEARVQVRIPKAMALTKDVIHIPKCLLEADTLIYIPKLKAHKITSVSLTMKLSQGMLPWSDILKCHRADVDIKMVDLLRVIKPDLSIIDGLWAMQGQGPFSPFPDDVIKDLNLVIAGKDPVAVDSVASAVMGFEPMHDINMVRAATMYGLGEGRLENIEVIGKSIEEVKRYFRRGSIDMSGLHPKIEAYYGSACTGCMALTRTGLDPWLADPERLKKLETVDRLTFVMGPRTNVPEKIYHNPPSAYAFIVGDCAAEHKDKGIFLPGCPGWYIGFIDFIGKSEEEIVNEYLYRYPNIEKPYEGGFLP
ncbi:MAG: DUF362 domain-containing protein [Bacillota bacterium]|nr:DUF362 domain-containing protein [Bacillota bacterium]